MTEKIKVIVKYKARTDVSSRTNVRQALSTLNASVVHTHESINAMTIEIPKDKLEQLKKDPNVEYVEETTPKDVHILGFESDMKVEGILTFIQSAQQVPWGITKIRATEVQTNANKGAGIKVCILDTGIDYNHEDLKDNYKGGYNFTNNTYNPFDGYGHGTHVAGTVGAVDNSIGVIGVAPEVYLYGVKVLDDSGNGSYDNIVAGIQWCIDNGMQVINMSFGGGSYSQALKDICDSAKSNGIVLVAAAGNSDGNGSIDTTGYPARFDSVIAVASTDSNDNRSSFSSCGSAVWVAAPGSNVLSTVPKQGPLGDSSGYRYLNGTSMSTPHVAGTVALMLKKDSSLTPSKVKTVLATTSTDLGTGGKDIFFGYGRIDAYKATGETPPPPPPEKAYKCSGAPNYQCQEVPVGTPGSYPTIDECQNNCKEPQPVPILTSITIPSTVTVNAGKTIQISVLCKDQNGNRMTCPSLTWVSDHPEIATVSNGVISGLSVGTAVINASSQDIHSNLSVVYVVEVPVPSKNKYMVISTGVGAVVLKTPFGNKAVDEACAETCRILKEIDK